MTGCDDPAKPKSDLLIGTWTVQSVEMDGDIEYMGDEEITFRSDGTWVATSPHYDDVYGTYTVSGSILTLVQGTNETEYIYSISGSAFSGYTLTLTNDDYGHMVVILTR